MRVNITVHSLTVTGEVSLSFSANWSAERVEKMAEVYEETFCKGQRLLWGEFCIIEFN